MDSKKCIAQQHFMARDPCTGRPQRRRFRVCVLTRVGVEVEVEETGCPITVATTNGSSSVSVSVSMTRVFINTLSVSYPRTSTIASLPLVTIAGAEVSVG